MLLHEDMSRLIYRKDYQELNIATVKSLLVFKPEMLLSTVVSLYTKREATLAYQDVQSPVVVPTPKRISVPPIGNVRYNNIRELQLEKSRCKNLVVFSRIKCVKGNERSSILQCSLCFP